MVVVVNYADEKFQPYQKLQTKTAYYFGADKVIEYSPADLDREFYERNKFILDQPRGAGYWLWKPYIIKDALNKVSDGDIVFYVDSGIFFINKIQFLIDAMNREKLNVMVFGVYEGYHLEKIWTKRDAFILMDCDEKKFTDAPQFGGGYVLFRKCSESFSFVEDWLKYMQDPRIVTDMPNQLGVENYPEFKENRHDQTVLSLLAKKYNLLPFRQPQQENWNLPDDVAKRSDYPPIIYLHRRNIQLEKTVEDFVRIYGEEPRLCEGIRSVKFLLTEGMVFEAYKLLSCLLKKYRAGYDSEWQMTWADLNKILAIYSHLGAPYAEIFQPLLCKCFLQALGKNIFLTQIPDLVTVAKTVENKFLLPQEFQDVLIRLVVNYIEQCRQNNFPAWMKNEKEIWTAFQELNLPETPLKKSAVEYITSTSRGAIEK